MPDSPDSSDAPRRPNLPQRRAPKREADKPARVDRDADTERLGRAGTRAAKNAAERSSDTTSSSNPSRSAASKRASGGGAERTAKTASSGKTADKAASGKAASDKAASGKTAGKAPHDKAASDKRGTAHGITNLRARMQRGSGAAKSGPEASKRNPTSAKRSARKGESGKQPATGKVSAKGHLRVSWSFLTVVAVVIIGAFTLSPSISLLIEQRGEIGDLQADIDERNENIDELLREVGHWNDPAYVQAQARDRLFYVFPDEEAFTVIDDRDGVVDIDDTSVIETELVTEDIDWATVGFRSIIMAGVTELTPEQLRSNSVVVED